MLMAGQGFFIDLSTPCTTIGLAFARFSLLLASHQHGFFSWLSSHSLDLDLVFLHGIYHYRFHAICFSAAAD
jgi:hypothetical protein